LSGSGSKAVKRSWSGKKYVIQQTRAIIAIAEANPSQLSNSILFQTISRTQQGSIITGDDD